MEVVTKPAWAPYLDHRTGQFVEARVFPEFAEVRTIDRTLMTRIELDAFWTHFDPQV